MRKFEDLVMAVAIAGLISIAAIIFFRNEAHGDDHTNHLVISGGPTLNGNTNPKYASIGYEKDWGNLSVLAECRGIFSDPINGACALVSSARVETPSGLFMRVGAGPAYYFRMDDRVSSNFNFNLQGAIGLTQGGFDIGLCYSHFSNAGLVGQNLGRDFIGPVVEINL